MLKSEQQAVNTNPDLRSEGFLLYKSKRIWWDDEMVTTTQ